MNWSSWIKKVLNFSLGLAITASFMGAAWAQKLMTAPNSYYYVGRLLSTLDYKLQPKLMREMTECCRPNRMVGSAGHAQVLPFLMEKIKQLDPNSSGTVTVEKFKPDIEAAISQYQQNFQQEVGSKLDAKDPEYQRWKGYSDHMVALLKSLTKQEGQNLVWEKRGLSDPSSVLVVGAHYDTLVLDQKRLVVDKEAVMQGADANATGVVLALQLIQVLAKVDLPKTVRIVFFDFQELGQLGSKAYVHQHLKAFKNEHKFAGMLNLMMLGHDTKIQDKARRFNNFRAYIRTPEHPEHAQDANLASAMVDAATKLRPQIQFTLTPNGMDKGDHASFWQAGLPAMVMTQNWEEDLNQRHHTPNDFVETLNMRTFSQAGYAVMGAVIAWAFDIKK